MLCKHENPKRHSRVKRESVVDFNKEDSQLSCQLTYGEENGGSKVDNVGTKEKGREGIISTVGSWRR